MDNLERNAYESQVSDIEVVRLKEGDQWSKEVSKAFMNTEVTEGCRFIDMGAGSSTSLEKWVLDEKRASRYLAVDISDEMLQAREHGFNKSYNHLKSNITDMTNIESKSFDISHVKLVLMHLNQDERRKAINEVLRVTKKKAFFLDADWSSWDGTETVNKFVEFVQKEINRYRKIDNYIGTKMEQEIREIADANGAHVTRVIRYVQEAGDHFDYLINLAKGSYKKLIKDRVTDEMERKRLTAILDDFIVKLKQEKEDGMAIEMASLVAVEVSFGE